MARFFKILLFLDVSSDLNISAEKFDVEAIMVIEVIKILRLVCSLIILLANFILETIKIQKSNITLIGRFFGVEETI